MNGMLFIDEDLQHEPGIHDLIVTCLHYLCRFLKFTDSRSLTMANASQQLCGAIYVGIIDMALCMLEEKRASSFYLGGLKQLSNDVRRFIVVAAFGHDDGSLFWHQTRGNREHIAETVTKK